MSVLPPCTVCHTAMVTHSKAPTPPGMRRHHGLGICQACAKRERRTRQTARPLGHTPQTFDPQPWAYDALCAQADPELWFPHPADRRSANLAIAICRRCPVRAACLQAAHIAQAQSTEPCIRVVRKGVEASMRSRMVGQSGPESALTDRGQRPLSRSDRMSSMPVSESPRFSWSMSKRVDRWITRSVIAHGECWIWTGSKTRNGYGQVAIHGKHLMAHRAFYTYFVTDIPEGLDLDHLCRNRACVNPWHLDPVTRSVNLLRGNTVRTHLSSRTHCPQRHEYDTKNTAVRNGHRVCRACDRVRAQRNRDRKAS